MFFWIIQYVSIISDVRFSKVYSSLLVLLIHFKSVIITTVDRNNVFWNTCTLRKCESTKLRVRITTIRDMKAYPRTRPFHNPGACCMVNWQQNRLYLIVQTNDPVYCRSKHRKQHKKVRQEICAMRGKENV